jgi:exodeoxyribonuclease-3
MRITTWNINSVRLRLDQVLRLLDDVAPDVLCLQEIKAQDHQFPTEALAAAGYPHIALRGFKGYNGVATISRRPLTAQPAHDWCGRADGRHVAAMLDDGIEVHNFYVPAGGDVPDPDENDKFAHKLQFLDEMQSWFAAHRRPQGEMILVGDLNIAPLESDVWNHKQLLKVVSHTPVETAALAAFQSAGQWVDAVRQIIPASEPLYSWWSYRARDWSAADKGRRLDHIWVTPGLAGRIRAAQVHRDVRGWEKTSDHAPVTVDID